MDQRIDSTTTRPVVIVAKRQDRPNLPTGECPFCPGGLEAPDSYDVRWFKNRWPAMGDDRCEVILYAPEHDRALWQLSVNQVAKLVALWGDRTSELGARDDVAYVLVFENRGAEVGATIAHPHGQIYAYPDVPPEPSREFSAGVDPDPSHVDSSLVVYRNGQWTTWVPKAAWWPYELMLAPTDAIERLDDHRLDQRQLAQALIDATKRLDALFDAAMPYMMWWHQRPFDNVERPFHRLHLHITPLWRGPHTPRYAAAAELGAGLYFNPVDPLEAARHLREAANG